MCVCVFVFVCVCVCARIESGNSVYIPQHELGWRSHCKGFSHARGAANGLFEAWPNDLGALRIGSTSLSTSAEQTCRIQLLWDMRAQVVEAIAFTHAQ